MELLLVIAILALLVSMIVPSLGHVQDVARKAVCKAYLSAHGKTIYAYVGQYGTYPRLGATRITDSPHSKIYAVMSMHGVHGRDGPDGQTYYDDVPYNRIWEQALCPGMDAVSIWRAGAEAGGNSPQCKADFAPAAIGYQWNVTLRGREVPVSGAMEGRFPVSMFNIGTSEYGYHHTNWIWWPLHLPDGFWYVSQALRPDEVENPSYCAEAWDSMDVGSVPKEVYWGRSWDDWVTCEYENLVPGWNVGAQTIHARGWALLPADRHPGGSPNILYVDGSVRSDANRRILPADIPEIADRMPDGAEVHLTSWGDYDEVFGTAGHLAPRLNITSDWP